MTRIFIDGSAGTTGLRIHERLSSRSDIQLITLPEEARKDVSARAEAANSSDITFLCLPDDAARETVSIITNPNTAVIDTSTAHRTQDGWVYGFAEICSLREKIKNSKRVANPGCHASGFVSLIAPLTEQKALKSDALLSCFSITGYSGGGKKMIAEYQSSVKNPLYSAPRQYALGQTHKHLKEMQKISNLSSPPAFCPIVADFYSGMEVTVPVFAKDLKIPFDKLEEFFRSYYKDSPMISVASGDEDGFMSAAGMSGKDSLEIAIKGNGERILLISRFDNLGKGASGAAIQNMNILLGVDETTGLEL